MYTNKTKLLRLIRDILDNEVSLFLFKEYLKDLNIEDRMSFDLVDNLSSYVVKNVNVINNYLTKGIVDYSRFKNIEYVLYLLARIQGGYIGLIKDKLFEYKNKKNYDCNFLSMNVIPKYQEKVDEHMLILGFDN